MSRSRFEVVVWKYGSTFKAGDDYRNYIESITPAESFDKAQKLAVVVSKLSPGISVFLCDWEDMQYTQVDDGRIYPYSMTISKTSPLDLARDAYWKENEHAKEACGDE